MLMMSVIFESFGDFMAIAHISSSRPERMLGEMELLWKSKVDNLSNNYFKNK